MKPLNKSEIKKLHRLAMTMFDQYLIYDGDKLKGYKNEYTFDYKFITDEVIYYNVYFNGRLAWSDAFNLNDYTDEDNEKLCKRIEKEFAK